MDDANIDLILPLQLQDTNNLQEEHVDEATTDETVDSNEPVSEDRVPRSGVLTKDCTVCRDAEKVSNMMTAACGHTYCGGCLNELFDRAAKEESKFPSECCGRIITLEDTGRFLSWENYNKFLEKSEEFSTTNRTYCSDPECVTFIPPKAIENDKARCPACHKLTCIECKAEAHEGDCPEDPAIQPFLTAAAEAGFQQCRVCKRMVERSEGCNHITCICLAEFCYLCGAKWQTCSCEPEYGWLNEDEPENEELNEDEPGYGEFNEEDEEMLNYAVDNVENIHDDDRIEWIIHN